MSTIITFCSGIIFWINVQSIVRTGLHTGFTTYTSVFIKINNAIISKIKCLDRANFDAGSVSTVVATHHGKQTTGIRKFSFFNLFDPCAIYADWNLVFRFTCRCTGMATDTLSVINYKSIFHCSVLVFFAYSFLVFLFFFWYVCLNGICRPIFRTSVFTILIIIDCIMYS